MSVSVCANCLTRLRIYVPSRLQLPTYILPATAPFSTTTSHQNVMKKKTKTTPGVRGAKFREATGANVRKKSKKDRGRPPAPGERKAQKKRIVLSNTNALEVAGLEALSAENMADTGKIGTMLTLNGTLLDQLRDSKSFKTTQNWSIFRHPSTLMRQATVGLGQDIKDVTDSLQDQGFGAATIQKIIDGERGSGKSIHLLQAQSMAFLNGWVVVNIPECQDFVINNSAYTPVPTDESQPEQQQPAVQLYDQQQLASQLLSRIASANAKILKTLKLTHQHPKSLPFKSSKNSTLFTLAEAGANDPQIATQIFNAFWQELTEPKETPAENNKGAPRPPVLVTIDGLNHWMGPSLYRNADYKIIHSHQFTLVRHFLSLLFHTSDKPNPLPTGGMVLAATSGSNSPDSPSFNLLLQQIKALQDGRKITDKEFPVPVPFAKNDQNVLDLLKNAQATGITKLNGLTKPESKGLLEYFAQSGVLSERITEVFVGERWTLSGGGVIGELAKLGRRIRV